MFHTRTIQSNIKLWADIYISSIQPRFSSLQIHNCGHTNLYIRIRKKTFRKTAFSSIGFVPKVGFGKLQRDHLYSEILSPNPGTENFRI